MNDHKIVTRVAVLWKDEEGIIHSVVNPGADMVLDDMKDIAQARFELAGQAKAPVMVDIREIHSVERDARMYMAGPEGEKATSALAFIIKSKVGEILGNVFINFNKPGFPTRMFTTEEEALDWLRGYI